MDIDPVEAAGVPTHLVERSSATEQLVRKVEIVPLEVIVRNRAAGSFAQRYGVEEGMELEPIVVEWCYKNDELGDPPLNDASAVALGLASEDELGAMFELAATVNDTLGQYFAALGLELVDFKLEFGRAAGGGIVLADEISPDTCRLWDLASGERLDKDRFRRDLGGVEEAYREVHDRVMSDAGDPARFAAAHGAGLLGHDHAEATSDVHGAVVNVMLKRSILDPQGRAVQNTLERLGNDNIVDLRIGKRIEISLEGERFQVAEQLDAIAASVLSNPVMEDVEVVLGGDAPRADRERAEQERAEDHEEAG